jgi:hypothetical protein
MTLLFFSPSIDEADTVRRVSRKLETVASSPDVGWNCRSARVHLHELATRPLSPLARRIWCLDVRMRALHLANLRGVRAGAVVPH